MAKDLTLLIKATGGDYANLTAFKAAHGTVDMTAAGTACMDHGGITGTVSSGASVSGATSGATGTVLHCTETQIYIETLTGTFQAENIQVDASNHVTTTTAPDNGNINLRISGTIIEPNNLAFAGWAEDASHHPDIRPVPGEEHIGAIDTATAIIQLDGYNGNQLALSDRTTLEHIQINCNATCEMCLRAYNPNVVINNVIVKRIGGTMKAGIFARDTAAVTRCLVSGQNASNADYAAFQGHNSPAPTFTGNLAVHCDRGFSGNDGGPVTPTLSYCGTYNCTYDQRYIDASSDYFCTSKDTLPTEVTNGVTDLVDADFEDAAGGDYRPKSGGALDGWAIGPYNAQPAPNTVPITTNTAAVDVLATRFIPSCDVSY